MSSLCGQRKKNTNEKYRKKRKKYISSFFKQKLPYPNCAFSK